MLKLDSNSSNPLYAQIKEQIRQKILNRQYKPGRAIPDERRLAAQLGVSRMTVRRAIVELSGEGLLERVQGRGTFVREGLAPRPRRAQGGIAVVMTQEEPVLSMFYLRMLTGLYHAASGSSLLTSYRKLVPPYEGFVAELRRDTSLKAIVATGIGEPDIIRALSKAALPLILLDSVQSADGPPFDEVIVNDEPAAFGAVSALLQLGHRDVAVMISESLAEFHTSRLAGCERALRSRDLVLPRERILPMPCNQESAFATMQRLAESGNVPTAIFCTADEMAAGAIAAAIHHGLRVPEDVSVIGFGDVGLFTWPGLSTCRIPIEQMASTAIQVLVERLKHPTAAAKRVRMPVEFIRRGSCSTPRGNRVLS